MGVFLWDDAIDIGHGVTIEARECSGLHGYAWTRACLGGQIRPDFISVRPEWPDGWTVVSRDPLTLTPSVLCLECGFHGFVTAGRWVPAP